MNLYLIFLEKLSHINIRHQKLSGNKLYNYYIKMGEVMQDVTIYLNKCLRERKYGSENATMIITGKGT